MNTTGAALQFQLKMGLTLPDILENLFRDLPKGEVLIVSLLSFLTAATAVAVINLILLNGDERQGVDLGLEKLYGRRIYRLGILAGLWIPGLVAWFGPGSRWVRFFLALLGFIIVVLIVIVTRILQSWLTKGQSGVCPLVYTTPEDSFGFEGQRRSLFHKLDDWLHRKLDPRRLIDSWIVSWIVKLPIQLRRFLPKEGYFHPLDGGSWEHLYSGHWYAVVLFAFTALFYTIAAVFKGRDLGSSPMFPTLAFVLLLFMLLCSTLTGLTFLLDRYRIPLLSVLTVFLAAGLVITKDHIYRIIPSSNTPKLLTPAEVIGANGHERVIVVAAAGGGIQAAGWTARVLGGLQDEIGEDFGESVRLISGVSGGSVGAMYFANSFKNGPPDENSLRNTWKFAMESSLDDIAWGLVIPDLLTTLVPLPLEVDRGWALEKAFSRRGDLDDVRLSRWVELTNAGKLPPVIFNATLVESGEPFLFSTTDFPSIFREGQQRRQISFWQAAENKWDIAVTTAARLSATFPFVSPTARSSHGESNRLLQHIADGGYYDNYGTITLATWLHDALTNIDANAPLRLVLILQILPFSQEDEKPVKKRGWPFQLVSPLTTVVSVRTASQGFHSSQRLELLSQLWSAQSIEICVVPVQFESVGKECEDNEPPLSWRLRESQKGCIENAWEKEKPQLVQQVRTFLQ